MTINCIIIDDEPLARKGLREYIGDIDFLRLTGEYDTPLKIINSPDTEKPQLIFLDIHMPRLSGLEFLKALQHPPLVIITTAYPQYALEGFELDVLDYLVKPVSFDRFVKAVMKAKEYYLVREAGGSPGTAAQDDYMFIKVNGRLVKVFYNDIVFAEALQNYTTIYTKDNKYLTYLTLKSVEDHLPAGAFLKVHKSYIVQLNKIEGVEGNELIIGKQRIPLSRANKEDILKKILNGKFLKR